MLLSGYMLYCFRTRRDVIIWVYVTLFVGRGGMLLSGYML